MWTYIPSPISISSAWYWIFVPLSFVTVRDSSLNSLSFCIFSGVVFGSERWNVILPSLA